MRKLSLILGAAVLVAACACLAGPRHATFSLSTGTNVLASSSTTAISGYIDEIVMELPSGTAVTGTVSVTATPVVGSAVTLASKEISATQLIRPRLDGTDSSGAALTSDPPWRYMSAADTLTIAVTGANTTGLTWRVFVKYDDGK
jgi:hypothetical protein